MQTIFTKSLSLLVAIMLVVSSFGATFTLPKVAIAADKEVPAADPVDDTESAGNQSGSDNNQDDKANLPADEDKDDTTGEKPEAKVGEEKPAEPVNDTLSTTVPPTGDAPMMMSSFTTNTVTATPSTNADNTTKGWAHVNELNKNIGSVELEFVSPRKFASCFEYRTDGDTSQALPENSGNNYNTAITDGLYPYYCQNNSTRVATINANEYVEVRMVFGAEEDERFDWTRFDVIPAPTPEITNVDAYYAVGTGYTAILVDFTTEEVTDATAVELRVNRADESTYAITAKPSVIAAINATSPKTTTGPIVITGSRTSGSWNDQVGTWTGSALPVSVDVIITLAGGDTLTLTDETISENLATQLAVLPAAPVCTYDFPVQKMWEVTWGYGFEDRNGGTPVFTMQSHGGLTSLNGGAVPTYMASNPNWHWLYVTDNGNYSPRHYDYGFADGTVRTADVTFAEVNGCQVPTITWGVADPDSVAPVAPTITAPGARTWHQATPVQNTWTAVTEDVNGDSENISHYQVAYHYDDGHSFSASTCPDLNIDGVSGFIGCRDVVGTTRAHQLSLNEEGGVTIWVRAVDQAGNMSAWSNSVHYYFDHTAPTTTIVAPTSLVGSNFTVSGTAGDNLSLNRVYVQLVNRNDNQRYGGTTITLINEGTDAKWAKTYNTDSDNLPDGEYAAHVSVVDMAGNTSSAGWTENFTVDSTKPTGAAVYRGGKVYDNVRYLKSIDDLTFDGTFTDNYQLRDTSFPVWQVDSNFKNRQLFCGNWTNNASTVHLNGTNDIFVGKAVKDCTQSKTFGDGYYEIAHRVYDTAGNFANFNDPTEKFAIDTVKPTIVLDDGVAGAFNPTSYSVTAEDAVKLDVVTAHLRGPNNYFKNCSQSNVGGTSYSLDCTVPAGLPDGEYNIRYNTLDMAGNLSSTETAYFTIDHTAPTGVTTYSGGTLIAGVQHLANIDGLSFTETITDNTGAIRATFLVQKLNPSTNKFVGFCGNWNANSLGSHSLNGSTTEVYTENNVKACAADPTTWTDGTYKIFHAAYDAAGNEGKYNTDRHLFVIDDTAPETASFITPTPGTLLNGLLTIEVTVADGVAGLGQQQIVMSRPDDSVAGDWTYNPATGISNTIAGPASTFNYTGDSHSGNLKITFNTADLPDGQYNLRLFTKDALGNSRSDIYSNFVSDQTAPMAPTGLSYTTASGTALVSGDTTSELYGLFDWDDVADAVSYNLYVWHDTIGSPMYSDSKPALPVNDTGFSVSEVPGDLSVLGESTQNVCVTAVDVLGNESACSETFTLTLDLTPAPSLITKPEETQTQTFGSRTNLSGPIGMVLGAATSTGDRSLNTLLEQLFMAVSQTANLYKNMDEADRAKNSGKIKSILTTISGLFGSITGQGN